MLNKMIEIICDYVEVDPSVITEETSLRTEVGASSFDLMNIAIAAEEAFGVSLQNSDLVKVKTVGDLMRLIQLKC